MAFPVKAVWSDGRTPSGYASVTQAPARVPTWVGVQDRIRLHVLDEGIAVPSAQVPPVTASPVRDEVIADGVAAMAPELSSLTVNREVVPTFVVAKAPVLNVKGPAAVTWNEAVTRVAGAHPTLPS